MFRTNESSSKQDGTLQTNLLEQITSSVESSVNPLCGFPHCPFSFARGSWQTVKQKHHCNGTLQENFVKIFEWQNVLNKTIVSNSSTPHTYSPYLLLQFKIFPYFYKLLYGKTWKLFSKDGEALENQEIRVKRCHSTRLILQDCSLTGLMGSINLWETETTLPWCTVANERSGMSLVCQ